MGRLPEGYEGPGLCTSIVAQDAGGRILLGRNLDWNLPKPVRELLIDIDFVKGGKKLFRATGAAGISGVLNGMAYAVSDAGADARGDARHGLGWAASINARGKGGRLWANLAQSLLVHSMTPTQHLRKALEATADFEGALGELSGTAQVDENYFIVAGARPGEGAIVTRGREKAVDVWRLEPAAADGWFRVQTNFDRAWRRLERLRAAPNPAWPCPLRRAHMRACARGLAPTVRPPWRVRPAADTPRPCCRRRLEPRACL